MDLFQIKLTLNINPKLEMEIWQPRIFSFFPLFLLKDCSTPPSRDAVDLFFPASSRLKSEKKSDLRVESVLSVLDWN